MNIMIDTNVIIDDILNRTPNVTDAREICRLVSKNEINGYISANSITDIYYIISKKRDEIVARKVIKNLLLSFNVVSVSGQDCLDALNLLMEDFEDALVVVCAKNANLDYIITNDKVFLSENLFALCINPYDFLEKHKRL